MLLYKAIYWIGVIVQVIIRAPFAISIKAKNISEKREVKIENIMLIWLTIATGLLPLIYSVTNWFGIADYSLPLWVGWIGILILVCSLVIFWRAHVDLKSNWSSSLELYENHELVTIGIYKYIRHPMYLSQLVWGIAQILLIQNWIAGLSTIIFFFPFYLLRIRTEEKMMYERFGKQYQEYERNTGRLFPKL
jgi:protein-S-isoprenylcysteine O-methyltransferase Ste14